MQNSKIQGRGLYINVISSDILHSLFYFQNILILILVDSLQFSCILPGSGLLDPILALDFPTKRDLYNLKWGEEKGEEKKKNKNQPNKQKNPNQLYISFFSLEA